MFPHPMYTVGYAFFYGMSLLSQSYIVLYVSVFAHFAQLVFLTFAENPRMHTHPPLLLLLLLLLLLWFDLILESNYQYH
jgi:phosphatidylethanolamine N-methyltransferase